MTELEGDITDLRYWGIEKGHWWEVGSGSWRMEDDALRCDPGTDPEWTWITSAHAFSADLELAFTVSGEAELVGIGFGVAKDFLVPKPAEPDPIAMRFTLSGESTSLTVDGRSVRPSNISDFNIDGVASLRSGRLQLKVLNQNGSILFSRVLLIPR